MIRSRANGLARAPRVPSLSARSYGAASGTRCRTGFWRTRYTTSLPASCVELAAVPITAGLRAHLTRVLGALHARLLSPGVAQGSRSQQAPTEPLPPRARSEQRPRIKSLCPWVRITNTAVIVPTSAIQQHPYTAYNQPNPGVNPPPKLRPDRPRRAPPQPGEAAPLGKTGQPT